MKLKRFVIPFLFLTMLIPGCGSKEATAEKTEHTEHVHTFSDEWTYGNTFHWHKATCGHDVTSQPEKHIYSEIVVDPTEISIGYTEHVCKVCGYSYSDNYTDPILPNEYSITFKNYDGTLLASYLVYEGTTPKYYGGEPKRENTETIEYTFSGWYPELTPAYSDAEYTACFSSNTRKYTVKWLNEDHTLLDEEYYEYGAMPSYKLETPTKQPDERYTYEFEGWNKEIVPVTKNTSYRARFRSIYKHYTITFKNYDGTILQTEQYTYGSIPNYNPPETYGRKLPEKNDPTFEKAYKFIGWSPEITAVTQDAEYTAEFVEVPIFEYEFNEELNGYTLSACNIWHAENVEVPSKYNEIDVVAIGNRAFWLFEELKTVKLPETIKYIGDEVFGMCTTLESINIPDTVEEIGRYPFACCYCLEDLTLPKNLKTIHDRLLESCYSIKSIIFPESLNIIPSCAVEYCTMLESVYILGKTTIVYGNAFISCDNLKYLYLANPDNISSYVFSGVTEIVLESTGQYKNLPVSVQSITILDGSTEIYNSEFSFLTHLKNIEIPNSITKIGSGAFAGCASLESINIPEGVTCINYETFRGCSSLKTITIPSNVTYIGDNAFYGCSSLKSINIPKGVTYIGNNAFYGCSSLQSFVIPDDIEYFGDNVLKECNSLELLTTPLLEDMTKLKYCNGAIQFTTFNGQTTIPDEFFKGFNFTTINILDGITYIGDRAFESCSIKSIYIPSSITYIGERAFYDSLLQEIIFDSNIKLEKIRRLTFVGTSIKSISVPDGITVIEEYAFSSCSSLEEVDLPDNLLSIDEGAFASCTSLKSIEIPNNVTSIGNWAFSWCKSLSYIRLSENLIHIGLSAFERTESLYSLVIPKSVLFEKLAYFGNEYNQNYTILFCESESFANAFINYNSKDGYYNDHLLINNVYVYSESYKEGKFWHYVNGVPVIWELEE